MVGKVGKVGTRRRKAGLFAGATRMGARFRGRDLFCKWQQCALAGQTGHPFSYTFQPVRATPARENSTEGAEEAGKPPEKA